jgi:hypothetical protein
VTSPAALFGNLITSWAGRLRFPYLFLLTAGLFLVDLFLPDAIPLVDEIFLALSALLLGSWKRRKDRDR